MLFGVGLLLDVLLHVRGLLWRSRKVLAFTSLMITMFASGALVVGHFNLWTVLIVLASVYRTINTMRIVEGRMHEGYLRNVTLRTTLATASLQAIFALLWLAWDYWHETGHLVWLLVGLLQLGAAILILWSTARRLRDSRWPRRAPHLSDSELPTLTIAIPARNETTDLHDCLQSLVASDYPKLEILVLDDCSQTRKTPEIIRSFAHAGVRFIEGRPHNPVWQPKNQAYDHLLREASGEYVLFCGVDVRFDPQSLRRLIEVLLHQRKSMMSLLPWRAAAAERRFAVAQAARYMWELAPPRQLFGRPPVLSTCWVAKRSALMQAGGFAAVARTILPEAHFARVIAQKDDAYRFMRANQPLGIQSVKPAREQRHTAIRMRYPQLRKRPENVFLLGQAYVLFMLMPYAMAVAGFWVSIGLAAHVLAALAVLLNSVAYLRVIAVTRTGSVWLGVFALPVGLMYDLIMVHVSMWKYEFSEIEWKGRNVCIPIMHVIPHLPPLDDDQPAIRPNRAER